ncbi:MAG: metallophosphoesterase family protein [Bernardetiaceae bacterium]
MKKIGLLSDTHGYLDLQLLVFFEPCDEIWHAGDIGTAAVTDQLGAFRCLRAVYGNIDDAAIRVSHPEEQYFTVEGVCVWMIHIGGYPPKYNRRIMARLDELQPRLFVCGHSHILRAIPDRSRNLLHLNPGAAGKQGFHRVRTAMRFVLEAGAIKSLEVIHL